MRALLSVCLLAIFVLLSTRAGAETWQAPVGGKPLALGDAREDVPPGGLFELAREDGVERVVDAAEVAFGGERVHQVTGAMREQPKSQGMGPTVIPRREPRAFAMNHDMEVSSSSGLREMM